MNDNTHIQNKNMWYFITWHIYWNVLCRKSRILFKNDSQQKGCCGIIT